MTSPQVPSASPLTEADFLAVRQAEQRRRGLKRAAQIARGDAISLLCCAAIGVLITVLDFGFWSLIVTVGLTVIGIVEYRGHKMFLRAEPAACRTLALNQLALLALIIVYCVGQMISGNVLDAVPGLYSAQDLNMLHETLGVDLRKDLQLLYPLIILGSIAFQGGLALYYYTRRRRIEAFIRETPDWIRRQLLELDQ